MKYEYYKDKALLNTKELLHYLNISRSTLYKLIKEGTIIPYKIDENMKGRNLYKFNEVKKILVTDSNANLNSR